jgi:ABC-type polar amino acid transport system ATPase subunit
MRNDWLRVTITSRRRIRNPLLRIDNACRDLGDMSHEEQAPLRRRVVGYVFQRLNLVPLLTAPENVMLPPELDGVSTREARSTAIEVLHSVGLDDHLNRFPDDFSGGQQAHRDRPGHRRPADAPARRRADRFARHG